MINEKINKIRKWGELVDSDKRAIAYDIINYFDTNLYDVDSTVLLTEALVESGEKWEWPDDITPTCDVPSTGGPSSLTTLLCPYLLAANGCYVPKLSVPGTIAGALDVLGLIDGFKTKLSREEMLLSLRKAKIAHTGNTDEIAPADGYIFNVRKGLGKKSIPALVVASLLSKKIAVSCRNSVVDVRCGLSGNFGPNIDKCKENSEFFLGIANALDVKTVCVITDISTPVTPFFGRRESLSALFGILSNADIGEWLEGHLNTCIIIAVEALKIVGNSFSYRILNNVIEDSVIRGDVMHTFIDHISSQGTNSALLATAIEEKANSYVFRLRTDKPGYIGAYDLIAIREILSSLNRDDGTYSDNVGITLLKRIGEKVEKSEPVIEIRTTAPIIERIVTDFISDNINLFSINSNRTHKIEYREPCVIRSC